ncbi:hypothetical protein TR51_10690 [Kitasatospora griseola]|uniref:Competence protein CoiA-like family protein n=2 Tax=Kitasatospora griseola TaxID=2064 RepID=A0A0D0NZP2_KITGR|nr:hypothetical protein TR51_10690 [Kitasatospora griseola]
MPFYEDGDTRKVQTAVLSRPGSDEPVFLPFDHFEFDDFAATHRGQQFYCGTLLGGCGTKLSAKRYTDKKCHFAHHPPVRCRRTANSESSADHLYIAQALKRWLTSQGKGAGLSVTHHHRTDGPGGWIDLRFEKSQRAIRVQLERPELAVWRDTRSRLARQAPRGAHWIYGPDSMVAHNEVEASGYALRVRCHTAGATRLVEIGTQLPGHTVEWTTLDQCRLTASGIVTPELEETSTGIGVRKILPPAATPLPEEPQSPIFQLVPGSMAFTRAAPVTGTAHRRFYDAHAQQAGSTAVPARISLPLDAAIPERDLLWVLLGPTTVQFPLPAEGQGAVQRCLIAAESIARLEGEVPEHWRGLVAQTADAQAAPRQRDLSAVASARTPRQQHEPVQQPSRLERAVSPEPEPAVRKGRQGERRAHRRAIDDARTMLASLYDQASEALHQGDAEGIRQAARYFDALRRSPRSGDELRMSAEGLFEEVAAWHREMRQVSAPNSPRLDCILQQLDREGHALALAELRTLVDRAEAEVEGLGHRLDEVDLPELDRWRGEVERRAALMPLQTLWRIARRVRLVLQSCARSHLTVTWAALDIQVGGALRGLQPEELTELLVEVDRETKIGEPPLAALVTANDHQLSPLYGDVLDHLDRVVPAASTLEAPWRADVARLCEIWRRR